MTITPEYHSQCAFNIMLEGVKTQSASVNLNFSSELVILIINHNVILVWRIEITLMSHLLIS